MLSPQRIAECPDYHREAIHVMQAAGIDMDLTRGLPVNPNLGTFRYDHTIGNANSKDPSRHVGSLGISLDGESYHCYVDGCGVHGTIAGLRELIDRHEREAEATAKARRPAARRRR
jgi:hypothetical protein